MGPSWLILGASWRSWGLSWAILMPSSHILKPSWRTLEPSWTILGPSRGHLGQSWGDLGLSWEPSWFMLAPRLAKIGRRQVEIRPKTDPREFKHSLQHHNGPSAFWNKSPTFFFVFRCKNEGRGGILGHLRTMWGLSWAYLGLS